LRTSKVSAWTTEAATRLTAKTEAAPRTNFNFMAQAPVQTGKNGFVVAEPRRRFHDGRGSLKYEGPQRAALRTQELAMRSALARLEARIALADHENLAAAAHDLAVAVPLLRGFEGRKDFHWMPLDVDRKTKSAEL
jgi:hypothetical protein